MSHHTGVGVLRYLMDFVTKCHMGRRTKFCQKSVTYYLNGPLFVDLLFQISRISTVRFGSQLSNRLWGISSGLREDPETSLDLRHE